MAILNCKSPCDCYYIPTPRGRENAPIRHNDIAHRAASQYEIDTAFDYKEIKTLRNTREGYADVSIPDRHTGLPINMRADGP